MYLKVFSIPSVVILRTQNPLACPSRNFIVISILRVLPICLNARVMIATCFMRSYKAKRDEDVVEDTGTSKAYNHLVRSYVWYLV